MAVISNQCSRIGCGSRPSVLDRLPGSPRMLGKNTTNSNADRTNGTRTWLSQIRDGATLATDRLASE